MVSYLSNSWILNLLFTIAFPSSSSKGSDVPYKRLSLLAVFAKQT